MKHHWTIEEPVERSIWKKTDRKVELDDEAPTAAMADEGCWRGRGWVLEEG
jgi:hypothetical protein